jgi:hypothetical protein
LKKEGRFNLIPITFPIKIGGAVNQEIKHLINLDNGFVMLLFEFKA